MNKVAVWVLGLTVLCCAAATAQEEGEEGDEPPPPRRRPAVWTSPFASGTLTEGEYLILDRVRTTRLPPRKGNPPEEMVLARYQVDDGEALALGLVSRAREGYVCRELLRETAAHPKVRLYSRPANPMLVLESSDGSAGFLSLDIFQRRASGWKHVDHREGIYQGELRRLTETRTGVRFEVITRVAGPVNAFPRREYRERWTLSDKGLVRTSRVLLRRLPYVAGPRIGRGIARIERDD
jgi:hypothetical protein